MTPNGQLKGKVWYRKIWDDERLAWDGKDLEGFTTTLHVDPSLIWTPDIALYNRYTKACDMAAKFGSKGNGKGSLSFDRRNKE